ncbi:MAG TPA: TonB-dependent receptor, partial [Thermoanaerobaculia bacterium]|nr:TonB-dependent receptor [Thermoanaerobaculia bacterium]
DRETAAEEPAPQPFADRITVTATRDERDLGEVPSAIAVVDAERLDTGRAESLDAYLNHLPGVVAQTNDGASDVKLAVRGFGARSGFGVRDLLVLVDGVPITDADGLTRLDQIDLAAAERVEVVRGPASALYGNAAFGGVVNVITRRGVPGESILTARVEAGDLGFAKAGLGATGGSVERRLAGSIQLSSSRLDGFRRHNDTATHRANGVLEWFATEATTARLLANLSRMDDEIPGSLDRAQLAADPEQVRPVFELFDHRRDDDRRRAGVVVEHVLGGGGVVEARLFGLTRGLDHPIFQVIVQDADRWMGGARWSGEAAWGGVAHGLTAGVDGDREEADSRRFANRFGERGDLLYHADETVEAWGVYLQDEIALGDRWTVTAGARWDAIEMSQADLLPGGLDVSDRRRFEKVSPRLAVLWQATPAVTLYANAASAFQVPTRSELSATGGRAAFNADLGPQEARHWEVGGRGTLGRRLTWETALFRTDVDDEILPRTVIEQQTVFGNVGETRHQGIELAAGWRPADRWRLDATYAWSHNRFTDFGAHTGNVLPGFPEHRGTLGVGFEPTAALSLGAGVERNGTVHLDDANSETHRPTTLVSAWASWRWRAVELFLHGSNLTDERYGAWIAVNDPNGFHFLPAPGRALTGGVALRLGGGR